MSTNEPIHTLGLNTEITENDDGETIIRNTDTGASIRLAAFIDLVGGVNVDSDEKALFGDSDQWSLRYDATATAFIVRDETANAGAGEDVASFTDGGTAIEFIRTIDAPSAEIDSLSYLDANETPVTHATASGTITLDLSASNVHRIEAVDNITIELSNVSSDPAGNSLLIKLIDDDAGGPYTITYGTSWNTVLWDGGNVRDEIPASGNIRISAETDDGGTNWWAIRSGRDFA